jgi:hypothetical protein
MSMSVSVSMSYEWMVGLMVVSSTVHYTTLHYTLRK